MKLTPPPTPQKNFNATTDSLLPGASQDDFQDAKEEVSFANSKGHIIAPS